MPPASEGGNDGDMEGQQQRQQQQRQGVQQQQQKPPASEGGDDGGIEQKRQAPGHKEGVGLGPNGYLLGPSGEELQRRLRKGDNELRRGMVQSILSGSERNRLRKWTALEVVEDSGGGRWVATNLGRTFVSEGTVHNLFAAVPAQGLGLGTVLNVGGGAYMVNGHGDRFPLVRVGKQLRFEAMVVDPAGNSRVVEFVHDTGAAANIIRPDDAATWTDRGNGVVYMGGFVGGEHKLLGGADLKCFLRAAEVVQLVGDTGSRDGLTMVDVLEQVALEEQCSGVDDSSSSVLASGPDTKDSQVSLDGDEELEALLQDMDPDMRRRVLERLASAKSLVAKLAPDTRINVDAKNITPQLSRQMGVIRRMKEMEKAAEIYPHLSVEGLNKIVRDGSLPGGIEYHQAAKVQDEATLIGRGTKTKASRKRDASRAPDAGIGHRAPFFVTLGDLVDLTKETRGNRFGYKFILTLMCKEYGVAKVYPITGKDDVRRVWRQFQQWLRLVTPYVVAKLGVPPAVTIFAHDRGPEFVTTNGRQRSAMDEELFRDGIARWTPSAGDSNKCGKIEVFNRILVGAINVALRRGGARNIYAYDAATHFEAHFNMSPTSANKVGAGEAPFKTIGIPLHNNKLVRFFCPAWLTPTKHHSVETGKPIAQQHLGMRKVRCFIIGYGSGMTEGSDSDGYKVVRGDGQVYSSFHVTPTPNMEVSKSFLTGLRHDPLKEGILVKRIFDIDGTEQLMQRGDELEQGEQQQQQEQDKQQGSLAGDGSEEKQGQRASGAGDDQAQQREQQQKMTAGTGVTGQMRFEMNEHGGEKQRARNDAMTIDDAKEAIRLGRRNNRRFVWKSVEDAGKWGKSGDRYKIYSERVHTFDAYDDLLARKGMLSGDLRNDLVKGHVHFEPTGPETDEADMVDEYELDEDHVFIALEHEQQGGEHSESALHVQMDDHLQLGAKDNYFENMKSRFFEQIVIEARENLGLEEVPVWLALGVFHHAQIWVDGRKQPASIKEAMQLPEWPEWREAIRKEVLGLIEMGVWAEVPRSSVPQDVKILPGKLILEIKTEDGKFKKCKARYVSRGDLSTRGEHYWETASHQVRAKSFRMFFATAVADFAKDRERCFVPRSLDIRQAYIKRKRGSDEPEVFMELPAWTDGLGNNKSSSRQGRSMPGDASSVNCSSLWIRLARWPQ
jgi:hypothetical protein